MAVTEIRKDVEAASMTLVSEWDAPIERVWQLWADPRKLERWWGPPMFPATVVEHDLQPGGKVTYYMTGPEGEQHRGWWRVVDVNAPHRLDLVDGFAGEDGSVNDDLPTTEFTVVLRALAGGGTQMSIESRFASTEAMQQMIEMGMEAGLAAAMGQIDALLAGS